MSLLSDDHHFPRFHVRPRRGYVNDPNGPVIIDDQVHLYFQYRPATDGDSFVTWGHASSFDYVNWRQHRLALTPESDGPDKDGTWSGCTVRHSGRLLAFYSAYEAGEQYQSVVSAESLDGGFSFGPGSRVLPDPDLQDKLVHFRDPFVWQDRGLWRMVVGAGAVDGTASARVYESRDLTSWSPSGIYAQLARRETPAGDTGVMWECPQVVTLDGTDVLIVCPWTPQTNLGQVLTLTERRHGSQATPVIGRLDEGINFYAASVLRESPFGPLVWGWATEARSPQWCAEVDWSGMITLPRVLSIRPDRTVASSPVPAMSLLRTQPLDLVRQGPSRQYVSGVPSQAEIHLDLPAEVGAKLVTVRIRFSTQEYLEIVVDGEAGVVGVSTDHASEDPRAFRQSISLDIARDDRASTLSVTAYVDGSILELFAGAGHCATLRMYPTARPPWSVEIEGDLAGIDVSCWSLASST